MALEWSKVAKWSPMRDHTRKAVKFRVATGVIRGLQNNSNRKKVTVEIDLAQAECKSAIVYTVNEDGSIEEDGKSIQSLYSDLAEGEWDLLHCRRRRAGPPFLWLE